MLGTVVAQEAVGVDWMSSILAGGPIAALLFAALYLIVHRGLVIPKNWLDEQEKKQTELRAECASQVNESKLDFERWLAEERAEHERDLVAERTRYEEMRAAYESRIAKLESLVSRNEAMVFELSGAARALAQSKGGTPA